MPEGKKPAEDLYSAKTHLHQPVPEVSTVNATALPADAPEGALPSEVRPEIVTWEKLCEAIKASGKAYNMEMITKAYDLANKAHNGVCRRSGEPYICHPLAVARLVLDLGMDSESIAAALLHDHVRTGGRNRSDDVGELRIGLGDAIACQQLKLRIDLLAFQQEQILRVNSSRTIGTAEDEVLLALILYGSLRQDLCKGPGIQAAVKGVIRPVLDGNLGRGIGHHHDREMIRQRPLAGSRGHIIAISEDDGNTAVVFGIGATLSDHGCVVLRIIDLDLDLLAINAASSINLLRRDFPAVHEVAQNGSSRSRGAIRNNTDLDRLSTVGSRQRHRENHSKNQKKTKQFFHGNPP